MQQLIENQRKNFTVTTTNSGAPLYQWIKGDAALYSNRKLWEYSRELNRDINRDINHDINMTCLQNSALLADITKELASRNACSPWYAPH